MFNTPEWKELVRKVEGVHAGQDLLRHRMNTLEKQQDIHHQDNKEELKKQEGKIDELDKSIHGNGEPGLKTEVSDIKTAINTWKLASDRHSRANDLWLKSIFAVVGLLITLLGIYWHHTDAVNDANTQTIIQTKQDLQNSMQETVDTLRQTQQIVSTVNKKVTQVQHAVQ